MIDRATFRRLSEENPGGRENRALPINEFEIRTETNNSLRLQGYASIFYTPYEVNGGPRGSGWDEIVTRDAFKRTLAQKPDLHLLINHEGTSLARTKSGTMRLSTDTRGLVVDASLDLRDPEAAGLAIKMERGDMDEMSFAFRVRQQSWSDDDATRSLEEVDIHKGDVSVVNFGANPHTSVTAAVRALAQADFREDQLAELRAMSDEVDRAVEALRSTRHTTVIDLAARATPERRDPQDGDGPEPQNSVLAQAVHDLVSNADGVWCDATNVFEEPDMVPQNNSATNSPAELRASECAADNLTTIAELRAALEAEAA